MKKKLVLMSALVLCTAGCKTMEKAFEVADWSLAAMVDTFSITRSCLADIKDLWDEGSVIVEDARDSVREVISEPVE